MATPKKQMSPALIVMGVICMVMGFVVIHVSNEPSRIHAKIEQQFWQRAHAGAPLEDRASRALDREFDAAVARAERWLLACGIVMAISIAMLIRFWIVQARTKRAQRSASPDEPRAT